MHGLSPKTSGADGIVDFGILPNGTYQLKETEAPEGYVLPAGQWRFTVNSEAEPGEHIIFTPTGGAQPPAFPESGRGRCIPVSGNEPQSKADAVYRRNRYA